MTHQEKILKFSQTWSSLWQGNIYIEFFFFCGIDHDNFQLGQHNNRIYHVDSILIYWCQSEVILLRVSIPLYMCVCGKHFDQKQPRRKGFIYPPVCEPLSREDRAKTTQGGSWRQEPNRQWRKHHLLLCSCSLLRAPWTTSPGVAPPTVGRASSYQSRVKKACHWLAWGPVWGDIFWIWVLPPKIISACFKLELEDLPAWREFLLLSVFICGKNLMSLHDYSCL